MPTKIDCPRQKCPGSVSWDSSRCSICLTSVAPPNVRWAEAERAILDQRYAQAQLELAEKGAEGVGQTFETAAGQSKAIFSTTLDYALGLLDERRLHQNYHQGVQGGARIAASPYDDAMRLMVDSLIFGSAGRNITMAALSLTKQGLPSYGTVAIEFHDEVCAARASLLSENSFDFAKRYPGGPAMLPLGHRATWDDRGRLALIRAAGTLTSATDPSDFPDVLMQPGPDRAQDRFMEVHIYETWKIDAVAGMSIRKSGIGTKYEQFQADELVERLRARSLPCEIVP